MKQRIDKLLINKGLFDTREKAQAYIMAGNILVNGIKVTKSSKMISDDSQINLVFPNQGFVSRGGIKLKHAIEYFKIDIFEKKCLDIGSSTGGFTDCLLKERAAVVTDVDVGKGLLHNSLLTNKKVTLVESYNARYIDNLDIGYIPDIVTMDVSFISIRLILKPLLKIIDKDSKIISLIKPQFELKKVYKGFKGVIRDENLHRDILLHLQRYFTEIGYGAIDYTYSPIKGPKGNIEYFVFLEKEINKKKLIENNERLDSNYFSELVVRSHKNLDLKNKVKNV